MYIAIYIPSSSIPQEWRGFTTVSSAFLFAHRASHIDSSTLDLTSMKFLARLSKSHHCETIGSAGNFQT